MKAFNECLDSDKYLAEIQSDMAEGVRVGVSGTPAMFINGRLLVGAQPYAISRRSSRTNFAEPRQTEVRTWSRCLQSAC